MKRWLFSVFLLFFVLNISLTSASLGIAPSKKEFQFVPGEKYTVVYSLISDNPDQQLSLHVEGDLAKYVKLDKDTVVGPETFTATINLPQEIATPGEHRIFIGANEKPREDQFLGTSINIRAVVIVFVPYPGTYAEAELSVPNGNTGELIPVEVRVINRGKEDLNVNTRVDFFSSEGLVNSFSFTPVQVKSGLDQYFRRYLNATDYKPGNYYAEATIDYGQTLKVNRTFSIGSLFVNITNFTQSIRGSGVQKFYVGIKSLWNNNVPEVYADVNLSNESFSTTFRTPSADLNGWAEKQLTGFVDVGNMKGTYNSEITLRYLGQTTLVTGTLFIGSAFSYLTMALIAGGVLVAIVAVVIAWRMYSRRKKTK